MKIATWNVNGVRAREAQLRELIAEERPDILCLQELKAAVDQVPMWLHTVEGYTCRWHGQKAYSGVALLVGQETFPEPPDFGHPEFDFECRVVTARLSGFTIASLYVPNGGKDFEAKLRFLEALDAFAAAEEGAGRSLVLCGDLNVTRTDMDVHPKERKANAIGQRPVERELLERIIGRGLVDVHRAQEPDNPDVFTWWAPWRNLRARNIGWRIDFVLASRAIAERTVSCTVRREFGTSDHGPVIAVFEDA